MKWVTPVPARHESLPVGDQRLVHQFDVTAVVLCPCGSHVFHHLTLVSTSECPRCNRMLAIKAIHYERTMPSVVPDPVITIGWVMDPEKLRNRETQGVH